MIKLIIILSMCFTSLNDKEKNELLPIPKFLDFKKYCETSGGLSNKGQEYFYKPKDKGIYGFYTLFDSDDNFPTGELIIHCDVKKLTDWKVDNKTQIFIKLHLSEENYGQLTNAKHSPIKLFNTIGIGSNVSKLFLKLGKPKIINDSIAVYWDINRTIGVFKLKDSLITELRYGRYNNLIDLPLTLKNIDKL